MMPKLNRAIICCSGASIRNGDWTTSSNQLPIWKVIKDEFVISANFNYKYHCPTILVFSDYQFYVANKSQLDNLTFLLSFRNGFYEAQDTKHLKGNNLHLVKPSGIYHGIDSWKQGFFSSQLVGIFMLTFAVACGYKEIFIFGMDGCEIDGHTHFYDEVDGTYYYDRHKHCGVGKDSRGFYRTQNYNKIQELNDIWYKPFEQEKDIKIFNVSPKSVIDTFPKISYEEFYRILKDNPQPINQDEVRQVIKDKINENNNSKRIPNH